LSYWRNDIQEKKGVGEVVFMALVEDLFGFLSRLRIKEDTGFEEISKQKIIYSETGGYVFWKTCQKE
jgi:hypothetical protein